MASPDKATPTKEGTHDVSQSFAETRPASSQANGSPLKFQPSTPIARERRHDSEGQWSIPQSMRTTVAGRSASHATTNGLDIRGDGSVFGATPKSPLANGKGFMEYIDDLETRVKQLESQLLLDKTKAEEMAKDGEPGPPIDTPTFKFEMKFFDAQIELEPSGNFKTERETMKGTFRSHVDDRHFLRVAYTWREDSPRSSPEMPMPDEIKGFALRLDSPPISKFLAASCAGNVARGSVVELMAPFRMLVENYHHLRGHLVGLQERLAENKTDERQEEADHFHLLFQFMDLYLARDLSIYEDLKQATVTRISFENLWMLFGLEETLYCQQKRGGQEVPNLLGADPLLTRGRASPQAYRVLGAIGGLPKTSSAGEGKQQQTSQSCVRDNFGPLHVYCFHVDFDGQRYRAVRDVFVFRPFEGMVEIISLEAYPGRFGAQPMDDFANRGRKFVDMTAVSHMNYEGLTASPKCKEEIESPVIIDMASAFQESPQLVPSFSSLLDFWPDKTAEQMIQIAVPDCVHSTWHDPCNHWKCMRDADVDSRRSKSLEVGKKLEHWFSGNMPDVKDIPQVKLFLEQADLIQLLPGVVYGYALRSRKWVELDIDLAQPMVQADDWKDLVLSSGHKQIVQSMVDMQMMDTRLGVHPGVQTSTPQVDLVRGKGKGCVILLHGAPGTGKTATAECVAAYAGRPLLPLTCGDLGYEPDEVERKLDKFFDLALRWGCVVLLDEADVFLAKRNKDDVKRNGLISVFLRALEFYSGILFLTTNRVGAMDDAFKSRLHLSLYYPKLDLEKSVKIWKMNVKRIKALSKQRAEQGVPVIHIDKKRLVKFATDNFSLLQWNGRQIRNSFQTALALAEFEAQRSKDPGGSEPKVTVKHFRTLALASRDFDEYLQQTHGRSEEKQAQYDKMRVEEYKDPGTKQSLKVQESSEGGTDGSTSDDSPSESEQGSDASRRSKMKRKGLKKQRSKDSLYRRSVGMTRQKSRDSIISLKKPKKRSSFMDDEYRRKRKSNLDLPEGRESDSDDSDE